MSAPDAQSVKYILLKPSDGLTKEHDKDAALMFGFIESVVVRSIEYAKERGTFPKSTWDRCDFRAKETKTAFEKLAGCGFHSGRVIRDTNEFNVDRDQMHAELLKYSSNDLTDSHEFSGTIEGAFESLVGFVAEHGSEAVNHHIAVVFVYPPVIFSDWNKEEDLEVRLLYYSLTKEFGEAVKQPSGKQVSFSLETLSVSHTMAKQQWEMVRGALEQHVNSVKPTHEVISGEVVGEVDS